MRGGIDIIQLFRNFEAYSTALEDRIIHLCTYQGSLNFDEAWTMTEKQIKTYEEKTSEKLKLMQKMGIGGLF